MGGIKVEKKKQNILAETNLEKKIEKKNKIGKNIYFGNIFFLLSRGGGKLFDKFGKLNRFFFLRYVHSLVERGFQIECQHYSNNFQKNKNEVVKLENSILKSFENNKNPSEEILQQRKEIVELISNCVQNHFGENAKLCIFGSSTTPLRIFFFFIMFFAFI